MPASNSITVRVGVGKGIGFLFGLAGFILLPYFLDGATWQQRWGILLWYTTVGAVVGVFGVFNRHPVLGIPLPWWVRGPAIGGWMNFVLVFFAWNAMEGIMRKTFGGGSVLSSPFWMVLEGAIIGLVIAFFATRAGGEGRDTIDA